MSKNDEAINLMYHRFRAEHQPMPVAADSEQISQIIEARVKPGLEELYGQTNPSEVDYAGYALTLFLFPQQKLEFRYPDVANALKSALESRGVPVADSQRPNPQDFWLENGDCFDIRALARQNPNLYKESTFKHDDFAKAGFILGPVIRLKTPGVPATDQYNQDSNLLFSTRWSVFIYGHTLMTGMYNDYPQLRNGFAIPRGLPNEHLANAYNLTPKNNSFYDEWQRRIKNI